MNGYGNFGLFNPSYEDTGEPFAILMTDFNTYTALTKSTASSHHIVIKYQSTVIKKIDNKYLPIANQKNTSEFGIISVDSVEGIANDAISDHMRLAYTQVNTNSSILLCVESATNTNNPQQMDIIPLKSMRNAVLNGVYTYGNTDDDFTINTVTAQGDAINCYSGVGKNNSPFLSWRIDKTGIIIQSSTSDSTKKFKIIVDDSGTLTATEYNE